MSALPEPITDATWGRMGWRQRQGHLTRLTAARAELVADVAELAAARAELPAVAAELVRARAEVEATRAELANLRLSRTLPQLVALAATEDVRRAAARLLAELPVDPQAAEHRAALVEW